MSSTLLYSFAHPDDESFSGAGTAMSEPAPGAKAPGAAPSLLAR